MSDVDDYVSRVDPKFRNQFEKLHVLIKEALPGVSEAVKWKVPYYTFNGIGVASIAEYSKHVNLYLMQGAQLSSALLEGTGRGMRHVTIETIRDIDEEEILRLLAEAGKLAAKKPSKKRSAKA